MVIGGEGVRGGKGLGALREGEGGRVGGAPCAGRSGSVQVSYILCLMSFASPLLCSLKMNCKGLDRNGPCNNLRVGEFVSRREGGPQRF